MQHLLGRGQLMVVETEDDAVLGTVEIHRAAGASVLIVRSGYVGRPIVIDADEVIRVTPATEHPDVLGHELS